MGLSRSTYYDKPSLPANDIAIVVAMTAICDEFEAYGDRRVDAELRHRGNVVNSKKVRRLMREPGCSPSVANGSWPQPTATTTVRSSQIWSAAG